jgi:hypothetical protein
MAIIDGLGPSNSSMASIRSFVKFAIPHSLGGKVLKYPIRFEPLFKTIFWIILNKFPFLRLRKAEDFSRSNRLSVLAIEIN